jgi:hypothetical protein
VEVPAGDVDEQCSRVEVVEDGAAAEDLAASGGDDDDRPQQQRRALLCIDDAPFLQV